MVNSKIKYDKNKKTVPLSIRNLIDKLYSENSHLIKPHFEGDCFVNFKEIDDDSSEFYFKIYSQTSGDTCSINYLPYNDVSPKSSGYAGCNLDTVEKQFNVWITLIKKYNERSIVFEDNITQKYYDDLEVYFKVMDEDADYAPFKFKKQNL